MTLISDLRWLGTSPVGIAENIVLEILVVIDLLSDLPKALHFSNSIRRLQRTHAETLTEQELFIEIR